MKKIRFDLFAILTVNFTGSLGFSLVIPILVFLVTKFGGNGFIYGVVGASYAFCTFLAAPILGRWSDIFGRKPIILFSQIGTLVGWVVLLLSLFLPVVKLHTLSVPIVGTFTLTFPLLILFLARCIDGLTAGDIAAAQAYVADISNEEDRNKSYGLLSVASNIGFIIGPGLAGILASTFLHEKLPVILAIVVSFLAISFVKIYLPESHKKERQATAIRTSLLEVLDINIILMLLIYFILYIGFSIFYTGFPIFAVGRLHWAIGKMGLFFSYLAIAMAIVQGPILAFLSRRFSDISLAVVGTIILGINFLLLTTGNDGYILLAFTCFALGNGIMWPSVLSLLSKVAGQHQGTVQGFASSAGSLASIIGLLLGGVLYNFFNGGAFFFSAGLVFVTIIFFFILSSVCRQISVRISI